MRSTCPHCKAINEFPAEASGTVVLCTQCKKNFFADPIPEDETEGYRPCPFCHERVRTGAKKCRWCQSDLTEQKPSATLPFVAGLQQAPSAGEAIQSGAKDRNNGKEEELFSLHPTWKRLIAPLLVAALIILLTIPFLQQMEYSMLVILAMLLACLAWFLKQLVNIITTHYILTTQRLRVSVGLVSREEVEIRVGDIRAVWLKQNIWERILRIGDVYVGTSATAGTEISIADIDDPREVLNLMHDLTKV